LEGCGEISKIVEQDTTTFQTLMPFECLASLRGIHKRHGVIIIPTSCVFGFSDSVYSLIWRKSIIAIPSVNGGEGYSITQKVSALFKVCTIKNTVRVFLWSEMSTGQQQARLQTIKLCTS
jgi:hypothetical protein